MTEQEQLISDLKALAETWKEFADNRAGTTDAYNMGMKTGLDIAAAALNQVIMNVESPVDLNTD